MDQIFKKLAQIPHDKLLHSFYGTLIYVGLSFVVPIEISLALVFCVAIVKEIYDEVEYGGLNYGDIAMTVLIPTILFIKEYYWY